MRRLSIGNPSRLVSTATTLGIAGDDFQVVRGGQGGSEIFTGFVVEGNLVDADEHGLCLFPVAQS